MKFEIKNRFDGHVLASFECESLKIAVELAIKSYYANLSRANLSRANLSRADLSRANLSGADLSYTNLSYANLSRANLSRANLSGADLSYANLSYANLSYANLSYADLSGADLSGADLSRADLSRADLSGSNLSGADGINKYLTTPLTILLDQPGKTRAYKLVNQNMEGPFNGGIKYEIGKVYKVADANINDKEQCAKGINLATLDWCMKNWQLGYRILIAEFEAKDIACIPLATDGKFRVFRCQIVGEKDLKEIGLIP
jgi:uncharacterized protein YjbI with pentapeptide repeats